MAITLSFVSLLSLFKNIWLGFGLCVGWILCQRLFKVLRWA